MKIVFVSTTPHVGLHERMAAIVNRYTEHQARALSPMIWEGRRKFRDNFDHLGCVYSVKNKDYVNELLEWADVIQCIYTCSLASLGRRDLLKKKICSWYLALKWRPEMDLMFPEDDLNHYKLLSVCEGWDRFPRRGCCWINVPFLIPIEDPLFQPRLWSKRKRWVSMAPRYPEPNKDEENAPRKAATINKALAGLPFNLIYFKEYRECMTLKSHSVLGIDDLVTPLIHGSGYEYLSLGVPVLNKLDAHLTTLIRETYRCDKIPFIHADVEGVRSAVEGFLNMSASEQEGYSNRVRGWALAHLHPKETIQRYVEAWTSV